ncbi:MAG: ABC transporter ATP-binding protein [Gammaproteobacteria bacterium]
MRQEERAALRWLYGFVNPYRARLALILALSLVSTGLGLAQPYLTKFLIDDGLLKSRFDILLTMCAFMLVLGIGASLVGALNRWHYVDVSARILNALRLAVFSHLQKLSPAFYARAKGGDLLARLDGDIAEIQRFSVDMLLAFVNGALALASVLILMLSLSWQLTLLALAFIPANALFLRSMRPRVENLTRIVRERASNVSSFFYDALGAMKAIQAAGAEAREARRLAGLQDVMRGDLLRLQMTGYATGAVPGLLASLSTVLVFLMGGALVIDGSLSLGTLIAFSAYLTRASGPAQTLLGLYVAFQRARVSLTRVLDITRIPPAVTAPAAPRLLPPDALGAILFEHVGFRYGADDPAVLTDVDIALPSGKKIGLSGVSGVGKTTLIDLLHRHYDPSHGRILLDGVDLRELALGDLRRRIAVVAQDTVLFAGGVLDNIRYAAPAASEAQALEAARLAQVDEFARRLPQGYATDVGSRGMALSGGQRQRIAIARALLQNPLVLVLDEATSAVDMDAEAQIGAAIDRLFAGRTRLIISHRPQTLQGADLMLELAAGRLLPKRSSAGETLH